MDLTNYMDFACINNIGRGRRGRFLSNETNILMLIILVRSYLSKFDL